MPTLQLPYSRSHLAPNVRGSFQKEVESLAARLAHDLRQPLSTIETSAYYLGLVLPPGEAGVREHLGRLHEQVDDANRILENALERLQAMCTAASRNVSLPEEALAEN